MLVGILLMIIPNGAEKTQTATRVVTQKEDTASMEKRLSEMLSKIDGVGMVEVMLTIEEGEKRVFQADVEETKNGESTKDRFETVIVTDGDRTESGLLLQENPPVYRGAIVICQGGDDPQTRLAVTEAVSRITGLKSNCISVLKMK